MTVVFNYSQQGLVAVKEGETLLLEHDHFIEAGTEIDEASLLWNISTHSNELKVPTERTSP